MEPTITLSDASRSTAGILLLTIPLVEFGGWYLLRILRGGVAVTPFQQAFARAGHAHAGVFVLFGLIAQVVADATRLNGLAGTLAHSAIPLAAILVPSGFFLSSAGAGRTRPNALIALIYAGMVSLGMGAITLGIGLLAT
jgi:hypothetical protein